MHFNANSKDYIESRLLKKAAELWGFSEAEIDAFDPLVKRLLEACAVEFEKTYMEINSMQSRVLERLSEVLIPDVLDVPQPAYGILQVRATEPVSILSSEDLFVWKKAAASTVPNAESLTEDFFFSAVGNYKVFDASVKILATPYQVFQIEEGIRKIPVAHAQRPDVSGKPAIWLGLEMNAKIQSPEGMSFYFDWQNIPDKSSFYPFLPLFRWFIGEKEIGIKTGLVSDKTLPAEMSALDEVFDISRKLEAHAKGLFEKAYIHLHSSVSFQEAGIKPEQYPQALVGIFAEQELRNIKQPLTWLKIEYPPAMPAEALAGLFCALNAFPVLNRKSERLNYRLQQSVNMIPLDAKDAFLTVKEVRDSGNMLFKSTPLTNSRDLAVGAYTLRYQGVSRFDRRDAQETLYALLELLKDESAAFAAIGKQAVANLSADLSALDQTIARLEQKMKQSQVNRNSIPYIVIKPKNIGENVYVQYWTTKGEAGNKVPTGRKLAAFSGAKFDKNQIFLLTTTTGGKDKPQAFDKIGMFRKTLLSRSRIVTPEDIRVACFVELGRKIKDVIVEKSFMVSAAPQAGFIRCMKVKLVPADNSDMTAAEWESSCMSLKQLLEMTSSNHLPYVVEI